ncbi:retrotransposon protein, putative, ty1-copia subclass, partial [Tanacetum coccineum]
KSHKVLGIVPVAIIDRQLPFEYTITSRSTDVVVMALPVQNINHSSFKSMFEREKLSRNNFNDWFRQLKLVLRVEKKMFVIEQRIPPAPAADSAANVLAKWNAVYDAHNEVACLMLWKEGKPVAAYVLKIKGYVDQLERLGYVLPQDLTVCLILNGLTKDFAGFVRNYNMHNMRKIIGELHAMLIEYKNGLLKKAETPQVMMIKSDKIQKANKKLLKAKGKGKANGKGKDKQVYIPKPKNPKPTAKEHPAKDDICHHCKEVGHWKRNCPVYLAELLKKKKQVGTASSLVSKNNVLYFNVIPSNGIYEIDMHDLVPNVNFIYNVSTKRAKHNLDSTYLWHCCLAHISKKRIEKLQQEGLLKSTDDESFDQCVSCLSGKMTRKSFPHRPERAIDLLRIIHTDVCGPLRHVLRQVKKSSGRAVDLEEIQERRRYTHSENDHSNILEVEGFEPPQPPQKEVIPIRRSKRTHRAPNRLCLNVEVEEHSLGDLNEPPLAIKAAI